MGTNRSVDGRVRRAAGRRVAGSALIGAIVLTSGAMTAWADGTAVVVPTTQNWTNTGLITVHGDWSRTPGFVGFRGQGLAPTAGIDPQTVTRTSDATADVGVFANSLNLAVSTAAASVGVGESQAGNATIAIRGGDAGNAPYLQLHMSTLAQHTVTVAYRLRDIDGSAADSKQAVALQYRIGSTGPFTNVPSAFVADATTGPNAATRVTAVSATLPAAVDNRPLLQVRWITANAVGTDEWVGVDDISVTGTAGVLVVNRPPTVDAGGPYTVAEGGAVVVTAAGLDPDGDAIAYQWDLDGDGAFEQSGRTATFTAAELDGPSSLQVRVRAADPSGASATASATVVVRNVAPTATVAAPTTTYAGFPFTVAATSADDPAAADRLAGFAFGFDCGDGAGFQAYGSAASSSCSTASTGTRTVRLRVRDKDGDLSEYTGAVTVIVTFDSLCSLTRAYVADQGIEHSLCVKLTQVESSRSAGRSTAAAGQLASYRHQLVAQSGKSLTVEGASVLTALSNEL
jgi:hypothetical protein